MTRFGWWVPLLFALVSWWQFQHAATHMDTARDWAAALTIARGERWLSLGPNIGNLFHVGPVWFYVLALPLALGGDFTHVAGMVAILFATQFFIAYALGERWRSGAGAIACAALSLPNWSAIYMAGTTHTLLVVPFVLMTIFCALAFSSSPTRVWAFALGLSAGAGLHAHPTTGFTVVLAALVLIAKVREIPTAQIGANFSFLGFGIVVLFLPLAFASNSVGHGASVGAFSDRLAIVPRVFWHTMTDASRTQIEMIGANSMLARISILVWSLAIVCALIGALRRAAQSRKFAVTMLSALTLATALVVTLSRDFVTFYMVGFLATSIPLLIALGWFGLPSAAQAVLVVTLFAQHVAWAVALVQVQPSGYPMNLAKVLYIGQSHPTVHAWSLSPLLTAADLDAITRWFCASPPRSLHGPAVPALDLMIDTTMHEKCASIARPQLGGGSIESAHLVGVACATFTGDTRIGGICWLPVSRIVQSAAQNPATRGIHPPREHAMSKPEPHHVMLDLAAGETLWVTQHRMEWSTTRDWSLTEVRGEIAQKNSVPWWRTFTCAAPASSDGRCYARVTVMTNDVRGIDAVVTAARTTLR